MNRRIIVFGATGNTGRYIVNYFRTMKEIHLTLFVRNIEKLDGIDLTEFKVIQGNALNPSDVNKAVAGQNIVIAALEGNVLPMAENIISASKAAGINRIIWMTGMGIHHEIKGLRGKMLDRLAKARPEYIKAADKIASSGIDYTLLRCPGIKNGDNINYYLTTEDIQPRRKSIDRAAIAKCMADMVLDDTFGKNQSLGITN